MAESRQQNCARLQLWEFACSLSKLLVHMNEFLVECVLCFCVTGMRFFPLLLDSNRSKDCQAIKNYHKFLTIFIPPAPLPPRPLAPTILVINRYD